MIAPYVFVSLFIAGLCSMVYAEVAAPQSANTTPSPYSQAAQKDKNEKIINEYFDSRDNSIRETVGIVTGEESAENSQPIRGIGRPGDGITIENTHTPSKDEATRPVDIHARQAQDALEKDLQQTAIIENIVNAAGNPPALAKNEAGEPDNVEEFVRREEHKRGEDVKRDPIPPEVIRQAMKYSALGGA